MKLGATGALALAAASTGVVVPSLRALVEQSGGGSTEAGVFVAAHVVGGIAGAALGARALRRAGSARRLAVASLAATIAFTLAIAVISSLAARIGLRLIDGGCHLLAITALIAAATSGDAAVRARRAIWNGVAIVLGVAAGLGTGALAPSPEVALVVAAGLSALALVIALTQVADEPVGAAQPRDRAPIGPAAAPSPGDRTSPIGPGMLAFGERFIFGALTAATPFLASRARVGVVLSVFMTASVIALPIARRFAARWGARRLAVRSTLAFVLALAPCAVVDVFAHLGGALVWAVVCGAAAGALYASALVLAARSVVLEHRVRDMGAIHAAGSAGHAVGALCAGLLVGVLPGTLVIALPGIAIVAAATFAVWLTVPEAARDCPVIGPLTRAGDEPTEQSERPDHSDSARAQPML